MKALALALALSCGLAQAEDVPRAIEVQRASITPRDEPGVVLEVTGGAYLPPARLLATGRELAALRAENASLRESVSAVPAWAWVGGGAVVGGVVVAVALHFLPPKTQ